MIETQSAADNLTEECGIKWPVLTKRMFRSHMQFVICSSAVGDYSHDLVAENSVPTERLLTIFLHCIIFLANAWSWNNLKRIVCFWSSFESAF